MRIGLGDAQIIDSISIHWPSGIQWDTVDVTPNQFLIITEKSAPQSLATSFLDLPQEFSLEQNYPNPFNPETVIEFHLPSTQHVKLNIYEISGILVKSLVNGRYSAGTHKVRWNGMNNSGQKVSTGNYFYSLETADDRRVIKKMTFIKLRL